MTDPTYTTDIGFGAGDITPPPDDTPVEELPSDDPEDDDK